MGSSGTDVYQIGRYYKINGIQYQAVKEDKGIVTFEPFDINHPTLKAKIKRRQRIRWEKRD